MKTETPRALIQYKELCKRINRLPLNKPLLNHIVNQTRCTYLSKAKYSKLLRLYDDILKHEKHELLPDLLDKYFKSQSEWLKKFDTIPFDKLKLSWPQVHLISELTKDNKQYEARLKDEISEVSLLKHFNLRGIELSLYPIKKPTSSSSNVTDLLKEVTSMYKFLQTNQSRLLNRVKIQPMEVLYPSSRFALPIHPLKRDKLLQEKISTTKLIFRKFKPIEKDNLAMLIDFAIHKLRIHEESPTTDPHPLEINKNYFEFMISKRKGESLNPVVRKLTRSKKLIPNDNNIRKIVREYVLKQFYYDDELKKYQMSWMQNFYVNKDSMIDDRYARIIREAQSQQGKQ